jgi:hypothetical protein
MFMSFFFLITTTATWLASHWWARRTQPVLPDSFAWTKNFQGDLTSFQRVFEEVVHSNPQLLILEKTKTKYLVSESPSIFDYGHFYHFSLSEKDGQVVVQLQVQPKLVAPSRQKVANLWEGFGDSSDPRQ